MENITIIALTKSNKDNIHLNNKEYIQEAKTNGMILTLNEFESAWNRDEISVKAWYIRVLEITKSSFRCV